MFALGAAAFAAAMPVLTNAAERAAPPVLTPAVARDVSAACPGTESYAAALIRGITREEAAVAAPAFAACAAKERLPGFRWKTTAAMVALAAVDLSRGVLDQNPAAFRRAADATADLRRQSSATDDDVRSWTVIPDSFDRIHGRIVALDYVEVVVGNAETSRRSALAGPWIENATYINVAARAGTTWIDTPRTITGKSYRNPQSPRP
jgi:hypothetical protein